MSIYASIFYLADEDNEPELPAPIIYHHSGVYPNPTERGGWFEIGTPPGHIIDEDDDAYCPYLRVSVSGSDERDPEIVVLDVAQVDGLIEALQGWRLRVLRERENEPHAS